jgi:hypothetical protein
MNYEQQQDQGKDAQNALSFLPKSMVSAMTTQVPDSRLKEDEILKYVKNSDILRKNINLGQLDISAAGTRGAEEKKNEKIAVGIGTLSIVVLIYLLFLR